MTAASLPRQPIAERSTAVLLKKLVRPKPTFALHHPSDAARQAVQTYIATHFEHEYAAHISTFPPQLISMRSETQYSAALGLRNASAQALFLEQYLSSPVEQAIATHAHTPVSRQGIVEVGSLVATQRGASHLLFILVAAMLHRAGANWMVFTATEQVAQMMRRLKFHTHTLCAAEQAKLPSGPHGDEWGTYYAQKPNVLVGALKQAPELFANNRVLNAVVQHYDGLIQTLAQQFREGEQHA